MDGFIGLIIFIIFWVGFTRVEKNVAKINEAVERIEKKLAEQEKGKK
jgi:hypothetical protein